MIFFGAIIIYPIVYPLPYTKEVLKKVPVAVVDMDQSQMSRRLIRMMDAHEMLRVAARPPSMEEAQELFYEGTINGFIVIPKDFSKEIVRGRQAVVSAYCDASYFLLYRQVLTGVIYSVGTTSAGIDIRRAMAKGSPLGQAMKAREPLPVLSIPLFNPGGGYATYAVPPVLLLILQQTLLIGIGMMQGTARESKGGRARSGTPAHPGNGGPLSLILGKAMAYLTIYLFHAVYIVVILFRLYRFPQRGNFVDVIFFFLPFLLSIIFLGFAASAFFKERETSMIVLLCTSIPAVFLAGFSWPAEAIPRWLRALSFLLPTTAGIDGFLKINNMGASLSDVSFQWCLLWALCAVYLAAAWLATKMTQARDFA